LGIAIDGGVRLNRIHDACSLEDSGSCRHVSFKQIGGFVGSASVGGLGGFLTAQAAKAIVGGIALAFGVTVGAPVLLIVGLAGAGLGAYCGGGEGSKLGEILGEVIYEGVQ
jgi:hypothetical protein